METGKGMALGMEGVGKGIEVIGDWRCTLYMEGRERWGGYKEGGLENSGF